MEAVARFDPDTVVDRLKLVRLVVAMANGGGGRVVLGAPSTGEAQGLGSSAAEMVTGAWVGALVGEFTGGDPLDLAVDQRPATEGRMVVEIGVRGCPEPPLVLERAGTYPDTSGQEQTVFESRSVYTRRRGRTERARRDDYRRWRADAVEQVRRQVAERLALVVEAPVGAQIRVLTEGEVHDPPSYYLSRATDLFRLQPEQLLSAQDLVYLWLHRGSLTIDDAGAELIVQSALRKRATLYAWLAHLSLTDDQIRRFLFGAVDMKDRDKSDAARAMLLVCVIYFGYDDYTQLCQLLAGSGYAHMREAAAALPDPVAARHQLEGERLPVASRGQLTSGELLAQIDAILANQGPGSRRVSSLALELLERKLAAHP